MRTGLRIVYVMAMVVCGGLIALTANADLVAYWNFDEGGGTTAADSSSNENDGILQGTPVWVAGHTGSAGDFAIDFAGGSRVDVPDSDSLDLTTTFTIAAWHYWNGVSAFSRVLIKGLDGGSYTWWGNSGLTPNHVFTHDITQFHDTTTDFTSGAWHHQAWTYDGTTLRSYYDGTLSESWTTSFTMTPNTDALLIGNRSTGGRHWQGYLDDVVIFDSVEDITQVMNGTHPDIGPGVKLSGNTVTSNAPPGTLVGSLSLPLASGPVTYSLQGVDAADFAITSTTNLRTAAWMNAPSKAISIVGTESGGGGIVVTNDFTITVTPSSLLAFKVGAEVGPGVAAGGEVVGYLSAQPGSGTGFDIVGGREDLFAITGGTNLTQVAGSNPGSLGTVNYVEVRGTNAANTVYLMIGVEVVSGTPSGTVFMFR